MADSGSLNVILNFLRRNKFTRAEAALRSELSNRPDLNGFPEKLTIEERDSVKLLEGENGCKNAVENQASNQTSSDTSKELIVKEIECGTGKNGSESKWRNTTTLGEHNKLKEATGTSGKSFTFSKSLEGTVVDLSSWNFNTNNGLVVSNNNDGSTNANNLSESQVTGNSRFHSGEGSDAAKADEKSREDFSGETRTTCFASTSKTNVEAKKDRSQTSELKEIDQQHNVSIAFSNDNFMANEWSRSTEATHPSSELWKDCSVKTVFPFPKIDVSTSYESCVVGEHREGKRRAEISDIRAVIKEQVDEVGRALYFGNTQENSEQKNISSMSFPVASENQREELPRLPPVKLKSEDKALSMNWEGKFDRDGSGLKLTAADNTFLIGSYLDVPVGQEISSAGGKRGGGSWLSVSQGIAEDTSDLVSGFATIGDGLSESVDYPNEYWDSDEYDDDDDVGYMRQPIEDETWFLAHEIDYPSDNEKGTGHGSVPDPQERGPSKDEDDDQSFAEEDSYFSGERYFQSKSVDPVASSDDPMGLSVTEIYGRNDESDLIARYDGQLMDEVELNLMRAEPVWQGFVTQTNELMMLGEGKVPTECGRPRLDDVCVDDDQHDSVRSIGVGINSDAADIGSEVRESLVGGSSEGDLEYFHDQDVGISGSKHLLRTDKKYLGRSQRDKRRTNKNEPGMYVIDNDKGAGKQTKSHTDGGFSFPPPRDGLLAQTGSSKSLWSNKCNVAVNETDDCLNVQLGADDMLASWRRKSSDSSPVKSSRDESNANVIEESANSTSSSPSNYGYGEKQLAKREADEKADCTREDMGASLEDEEAVAVQEQVKQIKAQEEEFETFNLKIVHRKNRTGFEEDKNFHVVLNSVIAGRYHVTEYLGSAAFSKAIQAHDLHTGMDVCVKIIKNNKDFFDQSLDEIKLLKFVNKHDPADKYHILRLYDYFYYREHLLIVCELLKANLYEFHKFNRESGGEVYFTMPRLQSITIQCLEALQFLHGLGLIHCDLKPENILVKSYSRCEVKVIDLGSSCFETDHLCSYVQSRSYRAPEVILGLPYDKKIDIWSLGCILAELCTGNVLFQNDSPATLLARVIGIIGLIDQDMLAKGRDTYKYFTKNHMLYERNQDTNRLEYLIPKKTSLRHRLPMGDQGFIDFVAICLR
ncbi:Dual-specificity kinase [Bertholletia excelsa]